MLISIKKVYLLILKCTENLEMFDHRVINFCIILQKLIWSKFIGWIDIQNKENK